jgi:polysaccharide export outer membrane protein
MPMRLVQFFSVLLLLLIISCSGHQHNQDIIDSETLPTPGDQEQINNPEPYQFVLGVGDQVSISVWRHDDLKRTVTIDPQGNIYLPLAGEILASGMTMSDLREVITIRLSKYIIDPIVDINASAIQSQKYYILGEVMTPGIYKFNEQTNILGGITQAGGFTLDADSNKVLLLRNQKGVYRPRRLNLDIEEISESGQLTIAANLQNRDIVYIPPKFIANLERFFKRFNNIIVPIVNLERAIVSLPDVWDVLTEGEVQRETDTGAIIPP